MTQANQLQRFLIKNNAGYLSDKLYRLHFNENASVSFEVAEDSFNPRLIILARSHYQESIKKYPISDKSELKKALSLTANSELDTELPVYWKIISNDANSHQVNFWIPKEQIFQQYKPLFWLPESLVIANTVSEETVFEINVDNTNWYLFSKDSGCISLMNGPIVRNVPLFLSSVGIASNKPSRVVSSSELPAMLADGLSKLRLSDLFTFFKTNNLEDNNLDIWGRAKWLASMIVLYFVITTGYLLWQSSELEEQKSEHHADVEQALATKAELQVLEQQIKHEKNFLENREYTFQVWNVLAPLFENNMRLTQLLFSNGRFRISGTTSKATELLKILSELENVQEAKFDSPVAKVRNGERFVMSFLLTPREQNGEDNG